MACERLKVVHENTLMVRPVLESGGIGRWGHLRFDACSAIPQSVMSGWTVIMWVIDVDH